MLVGPVLGRRLRSDQGTEVDRDDTNCVVDLARTTSPNRMRAGHESGNESRVKITRVPGFRDVQIEDVRGPVQDN